MHPIFVRNDDTFQEKFQTRLEYRLVPCGKCPACLSNNREMWSIRLYNELNYSDFGYFVTLTYDDENLTYGADDMPTLVKSDAQKWLKRFRKLYPNKSVRYFLCGEYGSKRKRPHFHVLLFISGDYREKYPTEKLYQSLGETWKLGDFFIDECNAGTIGYVCKYQLKMIDEYEFTENFNEKIEKPFTLQSSRPGIGYQFLWDKNNVQYVQNNHYVRKDGYITSTPRYYRNKIFSEAERTKEYTKLLKSETYIERHAERWTTMFHHTDDFSDVETFKRNLRIINQSKNKF